jgi:hypothetical protein
MGFFSDLIEAVTPWSEAQAEAPKEEKVCYVFFLPTREPVELVIGRMVRMELLREIWWIERWQDWLCGCWRGH